MTPLESKRLLKRQAIPDLPLDVLSTVRTNSVIDARPAGRRHSLQRGSHTRSGSP